MRTVPAEDQSSVPSTHGGGRGLKQLISAQGELMPPFGLPGNLHSHIDTHTHMHTCVRLRAHVHIQSDKSKANVVKEN